MKRSAPLPSLVMAFSLLLVLAIWLTPAFANTPPVFSSLGRLTVEGEMGAPSAMDMDAAGNLYVSDALGRKIYSFDTYGVLKKVYDDAAFNFADNQLLTTGRGLAVAPDGSRLYVSRDKSVIILDAKTGALVGELKGSEADGQVEFKMVGEIDMDAEGRVYVADAGPGRMKIKIYSAAGQFVTAFGGVGATLGNFNSISGMTVTSAGKIMVADPNPASLGGQVQLFTLDPVSLAVSSVVPYSKAVGIFSTISELHTPKGIAFDDLDRGYFLEYMFSSISVVNSSFGYLAQYNRPTGTVSALMPGLQTGFGPGQLAYVADVLYQKDTENPASGKGRLFVSCDGGRIEIFGIDGGSNPVHRNAPPELPVLQSPIGGSIISSAAPELTYVAAKDDNDTTLTYQVVVKQGAEVVYTTSTTATSVTVPADKLVENGSFTWSVQAVDSEGEVSGFTAPAAFVVNAVDEAPTTPEILEPVAEAVMAGAGLFAWSASTDPDPNDNVTLYQVEIAADAAFAGVVASAQLEGTGLSLGDFADYADLVVGNSYFCRVVALDQDGTPSAPSTVVTFTYDTSVLTVDAGIKGSAVYLGGNLAYPGRPVGVTPLELRDLAPGSYVVIVEAAGFEPYLANVVVAENAKPAVLATLKPAMQPTAFKGAKAINGKPGLKVSAAATPFIMDYDADDNLDLLVGDSSGVVNLFPTIKVAVNGEMTVSMATVSVQQVFQGAVPFVVDWNNDDQNDLLVGLADGTVKLYLNGGSDALVQAGDAPLTVSAGAAPVVIDLNRDGRKDLVVGNDLGQVSACYNTGTDAAPKLAAPVLLFTVGVPVVPTAVDWNADGVRELMVASARGIAVYSNETGAFVAKQILTTPAKAVFAVNADRGKGVDLILGAEDGRLLYAAGSSAVYPASYKAALLAKLDEVTGLISEAGLNFASELATLSGQLTDGSYPGAAVQADNLAMAISDPAAKASASELAALCDKEVVAVSTPNVSTSGVKSQK